MREGEEFSCDGDPFALPAEARRAYVDALLGVRERSGGAASPRLRGSTKPPAITDSVPTAG